MANWAYKWGNFVWNSVKWAFKWNTGVKWNESEFQGLPAPGKTFQVCRVGDFSTAANIAQKGSPNVFCNGKPVVRSTLEDVWSSGNAPCVGPQTVLKGSTTVFINGKPLARVGDPLTCTATVLNGSPDVFAGG